MRRPFHAALAGDKTSSQLGLNAAELHGQAFLLAANIVTCRWNSKCDKGRCSTLQCMPQAATVATLMAFANSGQYHFFPLMWAISLPVIGHCVVMQFYDVHIPVTSKLRSSYGAVQSNCHTKVFSISTALHIERCLDQAAEGHSCNLMEMRLPPHSLKYDVSEG
ncbi:hypothetical protein T02_1540 [Trichinella nativa]|uniref:Uncharacterized protein n=1 Tax=Trichinella nativa TaxID=6335 RepID=A0A0V1KZ73_9BILA|nr:hypothetical protein T02_1540 [Trichinella nativa]